MATFEAGLNMLAEFPIASNPVPVNFFKRGGLIGNKTTKLHPDDPDPAQMGAVFGSVSGGICAVSFRWTIDDGGMPEFTVLLGMKTRILVSASYCLLDRQYWSGPGGPGYPELGSPILPIPGTIVRNSFTAPTDLWLDIDMPSGLAISRSFDEWCDMAPAGGPD